MRILLGLLIALPAVAAEPPPYSLPWQLRGATPTSALRLDTSTAFFETAGKSAITNVDILTFSWKVRPWFAPVVRYGIVANSPPNGALVFAFANPIVGGQFGVPLPKGFRLGLFLGWALPLGDGYAQTSPAEAAALKAAVLARSAMDNTMFATNHTALTPGVDLAWVGHGVTVQVEATVFQLFRVRGEHTDPDAYKTNFTTGVHVGYFILRSLSAGVEWRYQRWLSTPAAIAADKTGTLVDTMTIAFGLRGHFLLDGKTWFRPGISFTHGIDDPLNAQKYNIVQIDLPLIFP